MIVHAPSQPQSHGPARIVVDVRTLRSRLDLDSGYLSRLLRSLEATGLVTVGPGERDKRVRTARLTATGIAERALLDRRSNALARSMLEPLDDAQRRRLVAAMGEVQRLLTATLVEIAAVDLADERAQHCLRAYVAELDRRFDAGFDPARSLPADPGEMRPPAGLFLLATLREAVALYRSAGYREVAAFNDEPYADHWFEKHLEAPDAPSAGH